MPLATVSAALSSFNFTVTWRRASIASSSRDDEPTEGAAAATSSSSLQGRLFWPTASRSSRDDRDGPSWDCHYTVGGGGEEPRRTTAGANPGGSPSKVLSLALPPSPIETGRPALPPKPPRGGGDGSSDSSSVGTAAAISTLMCKTVLHPIDTVKCRMQADPQRSFRALRERWAGLWTVRHLYAGLSTKIVLYVPYQATYMMAYERSKVACVSHFDVAANSWTAVTLSAVVANMFGATIRVPMEAVKMRQQAAVYDLGIVQGLRSLFASPDCLRQLSHLVVPQTIWHDLPYGLVHWALYETLKPRLIVAFERFLPTPVTESQHRRVSSTALPAMLSGLATGLVVGAVTTPLDVIKTRVVVGRGRHNPNATIRGELRTVLRDYGVVKGLFGGISMRIAWISMNEGMYFGAYEGIKILMSRRGDSRRSATTV